MGAVDEDSDKFVQHRVTHVRSSVHNFAAGVASRCFYGVQHGEQAPSWVRRSVRLALRLDPTLPRRVARLVVMGGAVTGHGNTGKVPAEFNVGFDPEAAHVVFEAFPSFDLVDWEATLRHAFDDAEFDGWLAAGDRRADFFGQIVATARRYNAKHDRSGLIAADALAMAVAIDPSIVTRTETRAVAVELDGRLTRGATVVDWAARLGRPAQANIVLEVDHARFAAMVRRALGAPG